MARMPLVTKCYTPCRHTPLQTHSPTDIDVGTKLNRTLCWGPRATSWTVFTGPTGSMGWNNLRPMDYYDNGRVLQATVQMFPPVPQTPAASANMVSMTMPPPSLIQERTSTHWLRVLVWQQRTFLMSGVPLGSKSICREVITIDASLTGWGTAWHHRAICGSWNRPQVKEHTNLLELRTVY